MAVITHTPTTQPALPLLWQVVMRAANIPEAEAWQWWKALRRSTYSGPVAFRRRLLSQDAFPPSNPEVLVAWIHTHASPGTLVELLEALVHERVMTLGDSNKLMTPLLARTNRQGDWNTGKETPIHG